MQKALFRAVMKLYRSEYEEIMRGDTGKLFFSSELEQALDEMQDSGDGNETSFEHEAYFHAYMHVMRVNYP